MLGAFSMTEFRQRLQESVARAIVMALSASRAQGVWGVGTGGLAPKVVADQTTN